MRNERLTRLLRRACCVALLFLSGTNIIGSAKKGLGDPLLDQVLQETANQPNNITRDWTGVATSVMDMNFNISGTNTVTGQVNVRDCAKPSDMIVTIQTSATLQANGAGAVLYFEVAAGHKMIIDLVDDLTFSGDPVTGDQLLLVLRGPGTIEFRLHDTTTLSFGVPTPGVGGGVSTFIIMEDPSVAGSTPTIIIDRFEVSSLNPISVEIGGKSFVTFAACTAVTDSPTETALLQFDTSNADTGRMDLTIHDNGGLIVWGSLIVPVGLNDFCDGGSTIPCNAVTPFQWALANFDRSDPAGFSASMEVTAAEETCAGRIMMVNENNTPFEFLADPWCTLGTRSSDDGVGCFDGLQTGFVLGVNGTLVIPDNTTFDYVGLTCNECPTPVVTECEFVPTPPVEVCPTPVTPIPFSSEIKERNWSAFVVDGFNGPNPLGLSAQITMGNCTALQFRSGVDSCCIVENPQDDDFGSDEFTIPSGKLSDGAGAIVLDVEGLLNVVGTEASCDLAPGACGVNQEAYSAKIEILSLAITPCGCPLLVDHTCCTNTNFAERTFELNSNSFNGYLTYNKACFFFNNRMNLTYVALVHTDENHVVVPKNDVLSEPTYVGGESWKNFPCTGLPRPEIAFYNSGFFIHTDVALTGVDLAVPNLQNSRVCLDNVSAFIFFQNGLQIDQGVGRQMILGTHIGSTACDGCTIVNRDAHLDVKQESNCEGGSQTVLQELLLQVWPNNTCIVQGITGDISNQFSTHTIYLGYCSNISIGADSNDLSKLNRNLLTSPHLIDQGNFIAFESRGGRIACPELSSITGKGGIFVDFNGVFCVAPVARAYMGVMVTKSLNGQIILPAGQVPFGPKLGIEDWMLDLTNCAMRVVNDNNVAYVVVVPSDQSFSDYTLNWAATKKNYIGGTADPDCSQVIPGFIPYGSGCYACQAATPILNNVEFLPTIMGSVEELQIRGSVLGNEAHVYISGGTVEEVLYFTGCTSGEIQSAVIVLDNDGTVGLGPIDRDKDSLAASVSLGLNGVTIIANGNGYVNLNSDLIIDNIGAIVAGPNFQPTEDQDEVVLRIQSDCCRTIRVKSTGTLDLSTFTDPSQVVELGGNVRLVLEPGAKIVWGGQSADIPGFACGIQTPTDGGTLRLVDNASIVVEAYNKLDQAFTGLIQLSSSDTFRAKFIGKGFLILDGCSKLVVNEGAYLGVETLPPASSTIPDVPCTSGIVASGPTCEVIETNIAVTLSDHGQWLVGDDCSFGGTFQVGDTILHQYTCIDGDTPVTRNATITFSLTLDGQDTQFNIASLGFVGWSVGAVNNVNTAPNNWFVDQLNNVVAINLDLTNGTFSHSRIYDGSDARASLLAFGQGDNDPAPIEYFYAIVPDADDDDNNVSPSLIQGGGNTILVTGTGLRHPIVSTVNGIPLNGITPGILGSRPMITETGLDPFSGDAATLYSLIVAPDALDTSTNPLPYRGTAARSHINTEVLIGFIDGPTLINRQTVREIVAPGGALNSLQQGAGVGAAYLILSSGSSPHTVRQARELP